MCNWPFYASLALALQVIPGLWQAHSEGGKRKTIKEVASWVSLLRASESAYVSSEGGRDAEMNKGWEKQKGESKDHALTRVNIWIWYSTDVAVAEPLHPHV